MVLERQRQGEILREQNIDGRGFVWFSYKSLY
jgi:hypothetical protein